MFSIRIRLSSHALAFFAPTAIVRRMFLFRQLKCRYVSLTQTQSRSTLAIQAAPRSTGFLPRRQIASPNHRADGCSPVSTARLGCCDSARRSRPPPFGLSTQRLASSSAGNSRSHHRRLAGHGGWSWCSLAGLAAYSVSAPADARAWLRACSLPASAHHLPSSAGTLPFRWRWVCPLAPGHADGAHRRADRAPPIHGGLSFKIDDLEPYKIAGRHTVRKTLRVQPAVGSLHNKQHIGELPNVSREQWGLSATT